MHQLIPASPLRFLATEHLELNEDYTTNKLLGCKPITALINPSTCTPSPNLHSRTDQVFMVMELMDHDLRSIIEPAKGKEVSGQAGLPPVGRADEEHVNRQAGGRWAGKRWGR